jgi:hypothetical protein
MVSIPPVFAILNATVLELLDSQTKVFGLRVLYHAASFAGIAGCLTQPLFQTRLWWAHALRTSFKALSQEINMVGEGQPSERDTFF